MSSKQSLSKWIELMSCPSSDHMTIPNGIDENNYIVIDRDLLSNKINCIFKYNIDNDKWNKINGFNLNDVKNIWWHSFALDIKKQMLFAFGGNNLTQIQLSNSHISNYTHSITKYSTIIILNDLLFVFDQNSILKWHTENKTFTKFSDIYNKMKMGGFALIYNHKNNCLLLFGGLDYDNGDYVDYILEFNINTKQWNKLEVKLPEKMSYISCTMAINNKYILLFGGRDNTGYSCDDIYIYSLKSKTLKQSKMKCPSKSQFEAITVNDNIKDEKITFGYIRKQWKICNINNYFLPHYLLKLIHSYYLNEYVYLLDINSKKHYKINTLQIV